MARNSANKISGTQALDKAKRLSSRFYRGTDVVAISKALLGKVLVTKLEGIVTAARIVETEAYNGEFDKASHAYGLRRTNRTEIMYSHGGAAYVYLCYGIHHLFNIVTGKADVPQAVLIRAGEPMVGIEDMLIRTNKKKLDATLTRGPGNISKALGIYTVHTGTLLHGDEIYLVDDGKKYSDEEIGISPRIGVDYAGADALLPYRFYVKGNMYVSGKIKD